MLSQLHGIKVILGYSWGWDEPVDISSDGELARWKKRAVEVYARDYEHAGGDGIYIQSFTETDAEEINGVPIAETVVKWVNTVGGAMLERWPGLQIQFGLHATSVRRRLPAIRGWTAASIFLGGLRGLSLCLPSPRGGE